MFYCIFVIIGTIIGAGFASGKEIFTFFNSCGIWGLLGIFISSFLIGYVIYKSFCIIIDNNITSYFDFVNKIFGKFSFINTVFCNIINIFLLISFIIMIAGFAAYFSQEYSISYFFGSTLIATLCFFAFMKNIDGIVKTNKYIIPFLIFIMLLLGFKNIFCFKYSNFQYTPFNIAWIKNSFIYASYNLIIVIPILISLKKFIINKTYAKFISLGVSFVMVLMSIILFCLLNYYTNDIQNLELPTVFIASKSEFIFQYICSFAIIGAIFTTALSSGYGFLNNLNIKNKRNYNICSFIMCLLSIFLGNIGFSKLLNFLYPILGFLRVNPIIFYN